LLSDAVGSRKMSGPRWCPNGTVRAWDSTDSSACRCWQDGAVTPPVELAGLIVLEDEDLVLSVPWEGNEDLHQTFD
jgi:hypothetical protein